MEWMKKGMEGNGDRNLQNNFRKFTWKQPKCSSIDEWIKKMRYIYTVEYHSAIKGTILGHL